MLMQTTTGIYIQDIRKTSPERKLFPFPVMTDFLPYGKHLKIKRLLRKMGPDFDSEWMSIETPTKSKKSNQLPDIYLVQQENRIEDGLLKHRLVHLVEFHSHGMNLSKQSKEDIKTFLQKMSSCEVNFEWEDLGNLFFPRNIRSGECVSKSACSWPAGMLCQSSENKTLHVLHWRCSRRKHKKSNSLSRTVKENRTNDNKRTWRRQTRSSGGAMKKKLKCRWKKIPYKVTTKCECSC